ncbi:hypothetical protein BEWA_015730 [Theileria equi strain WA]|uniref:Uncharacterized protein n=1 Tax=Theileria equi strain WA TaxID=1537102 RepID=L1LC37_THEEQ|nr:hypothetical protein BEWA_015730 [Theileria equi strain WA]EKX73012.1 hypothetical protein BEWA_015730 [Theileria equi strain WA]|eukprot:XP_004832464.1 hypothetical protein BEWA_015730 [Theileria equi strain WA]
MPKVEYLEKSRPILHRALEKRSTLELLSRDFCTVSDLVSKIQEPIDLECVPDYAPKAVNIVLQFRELCKEGALARHRRDHEEHVNQRGDDTGGNEDVAEKIHDGITEPTGCSVNDYAYNMGQSVYIAGDPTGSIYVLADELDIDIIGNTFILLHTALNVMNGRIVLQILRDTKFIKCSDSIKEFANAENISEKYKFEIRSKIL